MHYILSIPISNERKLFATINNLKLRASIGRRPIFMRTEGRSIQATAEQISPNHVQRLNSGPVSNRAHIAAVLACYLWWSTNRSGGRERSALYVYPFRVGLRVLRRPSLPPSILGLLLLLPFWLTANHYFAPSPSFCSSHQPLKRAQAWSSRL